MLMMAHVCLAMLVGHGEKHNCPGIEGWLAVGVDK